MSREEIKPLPILSGGDLLSLGYVEGPKIGQILRSLEEQQLEGRLKTKEEAAEWVKKTF
jgi:poly(A) polymerase